MNESDLGMSEIANMEDQMHDTLRELKERDWEEHLDEVEAILREEDVPRVEKYDVVDFDIFELEGDISDGIRYLQTIRNKYPDQRVQLEIDRHYDDYDFELKVWREETDEEFQERLHELRVSKWQAAEHERIATIKRKWKRKTRRDEISNRIAELQAELNGIDKRIEADG